MSLKTPGLLPEIVTTLGAIGLEMFEMGDLGAPSAQRIQDSRNQYGSPSSLLVWAVVAVVVAWAVVAIVAVMAVMVMAATYLTCQKHVGFNNFGGLGGSGGFGGTVPAVLAVLAVRSRWLRAQWRCTKSIKNPHVLPN